MSYFSSAGATQTFSVGTAAQRHPAGSGNQAQRVVVIALVDRDVSTRADAQVFQELSQL